jgi:hypothetical protein
MASVITLKTTLDVLPKYESLIQSSFGSEGTFIRAKENISAMFKEYSISSADKAGILANILGSLTSSIANTSMQIALQWATEERKLEFEKQDLDLRIQLGNADNALKEAQEKKLMYDAQATQAESIRLMGNRTTDPLDRWQVMQLAEEGKVIKDMEVDTKRIQNMTKEGYVLDTKLDESYATVHKIMAETYVNFGNYTYELNSSGAQKVTQSSFEESLSKMQSLIAKEQAKGYTYNAWANAVTASAGMLGTAIASDGAIKDIEKLVEVFKGSVNKLSKLSSPFPQDDVPNYSTPTTPLPPEEEEEEEEEP